MLLASPRDDAARGRLLDIVRRLRPLLLWGSALTASVGALAALELGWALPLPLLPGLAALLALGGRLSRMRRPELALILALALLEGGLAGSIALARGDRLLLLPALIGPALVAGALFPPRLAAVAASAAAQLMIGLALALGFGAVRALPPLLLFPLATLVCGAGIATIVASLDIDVRAFATVDQLTGLPNRIALRAHVAELEHVARVCGRPVALIVADMDRFKAINDRFGHARGDAVLRELGERLRAALIDGATACRPGGEEFVVLIPDAELERGASLAEAIRAAVAQRPLAGARLTVSLGVAATRAGEPFHFAELFERADAALYAAKRAGGDRVELYAKGRPLSSGEEGARAPSRGRRLRGSARAPHPQLGDGEAERRQLRELNARLRERAKPAFVVAFALGGVSALYDGALILVPPLLATIAYLLTRRRAQRAKHPELVLAAGWLGLEGSLLASGLLASHPMIYALPILVLPVIGSAAVLPERTALIGTAGTAAMIVGLALGAGLPQGVEPAIVAGDLALLALAALLGIELGRSTSAYRDLTVADELTGLFSRAALMRRVGELQERGVSGGAVLVADVDRFKAINDRFGHACGDAVLRELGTRVRMALRAFEPAYRIGGEELVVLLEEASLQQAEQLAERLRAVIADRPLAGVETTVSVGIAAAPAGERFDFQRLFAEADAALYRAKRAGGNCVQTAAAPAARRHGEPLAV
ncbi:MAG TPA: GGDEF domain-containing protein [Solirubrobacteraceae bacterium]|nr:GGDEF domain-containing protein [Solirubrobacteraceae bacterium]